MQSCCFFFIPIVVVDSEKNIQGIHYEFLKEKVSEDVASQISEEKQKATAVVQEAIQKL